MKCDFGFQSEVWLASTLGRTGGEVGRVIGLKFGRILGNMVNSRW